MENQKTTATEKVLKHGLLVKGGNFILDKKVESIDEFWVLSGRGWFACT